MGIGCCSYGVEAQLCRKMSRVFDVQNVRWHSFMMIITIYFFVGGNDVSGQIRRYNVTCASLFPSSCSTNSGCTGNYTLSQNCSASGSINIANGGYLSVVGIGGKPAMDGNWDLVANSYNGHTIFSGSSHGGILRIENIIITHANHAINLASINLIVLNCIITDNMVYLGGVSRSVHIPY